MSLGGATLSRPRKKKMAISDFIFAAIQFYFENIDIHIDWYDF